MVLIVVAVHKGLVVVDKVYLILIEAITVVEHASRPCLDLVGWVVGGAEPFYCQTQPFVEVRLGF